MDLLQIAWVLIVPLEIALLFFFYKYYFANYNADKWVERSKEEGFLTDILGDVIDTICLDVSDNVIERLKLEMLASQGTMTRQNNKPENEAEFGLMMAQKVLNEIGFKNINPIMALRVANGLKSFITKNKGDNEVEYEDNLLKSPIL